MDSDVTAADDPRKTWSGLRKLCPAGTKTDGANAVLTSAMLTTNRKKMGIYAVRGDQAVHLVSIAGYNQLVADSRFVSVEKYGPAVSLIPGELGRVDGVPVVPSEQIRQDLNASGVFDGVTTSRSIAITVNRRAYVLGFRPPGSGANSRSTNPGKADVQILKERYFDTGEVGLRVQLRRAFGALYGGSETSVAVTYNLATT
jgi:hypothetical protein